MWKSVKYYKALSNHKRLAIVQLIDGNEKTVGDIVERLHLRQANVSQHLAILKEVGIIAMRRKGKNVYYHLKNGVE